MRRMNASEFKAKCLGLFDEVKGTGETIAILKHGEEVARVVPPATQRYPQDELRGSVRVLGDVVSPATAPEEWDAERGEWEPG